MTKKSKVSITISIAAFSQHFAEEETFAIPFKVACRENRRRKDMPMLDFPLLPYSEHYRVKNLNLPFSSSLASTQTNSGWKGPQNSSFDLKENKKQKQTHRQFYV